MQGYEKEKERRTLNSGAASLYAAPNARTPPFKRKQLVARLNRVSVMNELCVRFWPKKAVPG